MTKGTTILGQMLQLIPNSLFDKLATIYQVDKGARKMTGAAHLAVMLYAQLADLTSLREIEQATCALTAKQRACGLIHAPHSTLAEANSRIPWQFYRDLFTALLHHVMPQFPKHRFDLPGKLLTLDSSLVSVCLERFPWATYRTRKGALKLHTLLDHDGYLPRTVIITDGKVHDIRVAREMTFQAGDTLLVDRAYCDGAWLYDLHQKGVRFVIRKKSRTGFEGTAQPVDRSQGIWSDWIGTLQGTYRESCPATLRLIRYKDRETKKELEFLTNMLDEDAAMIALLYKQRWHVELFFKWIKQNLKIKVFLGTNPNAVMTQIWIAMIAYLLIQVKAVTASKHVTAHLLRTYIKTRTLMCIPLSQAWQAFQRTRKQKKRNPKMLSRILHE